jgi:acyl carrier protein
MTNYFNEKTLVSQVERIIRQQTEADAELTPETDLLNDLAIDSLEQVELGLAIEQELGTTLPRTKLRLCVTVGELVQLVQQAILADQVEPV